MMKSFQIVTIGLLALLAAGCGYSRVHAKVPGGGDSIIVPLAINHTAAKDLSEPLTSVLRKRVAKAGVGVGSEDPRAASLEVTVVMVGDSPGQLGTNATELMALDKIYTIHADVTVMSSAGSPIKGPKRFVVHGRSYARDAARADDVFGSKRLKLLLEDLTDEIVEYFFYY